MVRSCLPSATAGTATKGPGCIPETSCSVNIEAISGTDSAARQPDGVDNRNSHRPNNGAWTSVRTPVHGGMGRSAIALPCPCSGPRPAMLLISDYKG